VSLNGEYGASKIGSTRVVQVAAAAWTEAVLTALSAGRVRKPTSFVVKAAGTVYAFQGNHALTIGNVAYVPPVAPDVAVAGTGPGYFELLQDVPWRIDVESAGDNSLWLWAAALTVVRIAEITSTPFDGS
jgi:hypothetical protein